MARRDPSLRPIDAHGPPGPAGAFLRAALAGAVAWLALTEGDLSSLVIGAPTVLAAAWAATAAGLGRMLPRAGALAAFLPFFARELLASAALLARRVLSRDPGFRPGVTVWPLRLKGEGARAAFMNAVSLTPGTLSTRLDGDRLWVHVLDVGEDARPTLDALERRVARLYGETEP